jgi:hypothetical protein
MGSSHEPNKGIFMKLKTTLAALIISGLALPVLAQSSPPAVDPAATPGIDKRLDNQEKRIEQGTQSGALTSREARRLKAREARTEADLAAAKADGQVSRVERKGLHQELNGNSRAIRRQKHDRQHH